MAKKKKKKQKKHFHQFTAKEKLLHLAPRSLAVFFAVFLSLFALDVFSAGYTFMQTAIALFMHLIPSFLIIGCIWVAWKWENYGAYLFLILGVVFILWFKPDNKLSYIFIPSPLFLIGVLFLLDYHLRKKKS